MTSLASTSSAPTSSSAVLQTPEPEPEPPACAEAADCLLCATERNCGCLAQPKALGCPDALDPCFAFPCMYNDVACVAGTCRVGPPAGPCREDRDCEARRDPYACRYIPVRASAPAHPGGGGMGCGGLPKRPVAHCDAIEGRCVLPTAAGPSPSPARHLRWSCVTHGVAVTTQAFEISGTQLTVEASGATPRKIALTPADLTRVTALLTDEDFTRFVAETPPPGPAHPGMQECTLTVQPKKGRRKGTRKDPTTDPKPDTRLAWPAIAGKQWRSGAEFSEAAGAGKAALAKELWALSRRSEP
ncbi:MAG: hypothetical protein AAF721_33480 [Myxococcota bacterium]